jgi:hypothetical protein
VKFFVGLENGDENRSVAWVFDQPGCFAYGHSPEEALAAAPTAIHAFQTWASAYAGESWLDLHDIEVVQAESWQVYNINEAYERVESGYSVNAWFQHDWKPLEAYEIERGLKILAWNRADLLEILQGLSPDQLSRKLHGERWDIDGIVRHIAGAEWWYLDRLGMAFPRSELPINTLDRLEKVRALLNETLEHLAGSRQVTGVEGEFWSPRKLLRRVAWHERDHILHILKLVER